MHGAQHIEREETVITITESIASSRSGQWGTREEFGLWRHLICNKILLYYLSVGHIDLTCTDLVSLCVQWEWKKKKTILQGFLRLLFFCPTLVFVFHWQWFHWCISLYKGRFLAYIPSSSSNMLSPCPRVTPWTVAHQSPLFIRFLRQEYWNAWPFFSAGIESGSLELEAGSFLTKPPAESH